MTETDRKIASALGAFIVFCLLGILINKRTIGDLIFMVVGGLAVIALIVVLSSSGARQRRAAGRSRARARVLREAQWRPVLATWEGSDAIVMRKSAVVDDEVVLAEPDRLFSRILSPPESPAFDGEVAEVMGRAELRAGTMNARD